MKKFFYSILAASMLFACSQEEVMDVTAPESQQVTITVELPSIESRAIAQGVDVGKGNMANKLVYAMYEEDQRTGEPLVTDFVDRGTDGKFKVTVPMAKNLKYDLLFLAYNKENPAFVINAQDAGANNLNELKLRTDLKANQESYDAFVGVLDSHGIQDANTVTLTRPFAQINAVTTADDLAAVKVLKSEVTTSKLVISAPNTYNVFTGAATNKVQLTYDASAIIQDYTLANDANAYPKNEKFNSEYYYLTLTYVLAGDNPNATASTHNATFEFYRQNGDLVSKLDIVSLPLQRNFRTNVMGSLLTKSEEYTITIDANFGEPANIVELWDGKTLNEPAYDETTKTYYIYNAAELAYIAALVNGTLDTDNVSRTAVSADDLNGKIISLMDDIYLNNAEWTPIGHGSNHFRGTLEGNGKTIHGLKITQRGDTRAALFGTVSYTVTFRSLTIKGASIECPDFDGDFYGSALIGTAYGNVTIENVDVVDSYISGNNKVGALLAHDGVVSSLKINGCDVSGVRFEASNINDGGSVGGLVGYFQGQGGGEYKIENNTVKNCVFNVVNSTNTGKRANGLLMGGIGAKANQILKISNCITDGNTWNETFYVKGEEVTSETFVSPFNGLIGGERNDYATIVGEVWIDGTLYTPHTVAKIGNTEYYSIDEAIANWTNNTTLTLVDNVTLTDVIKIKSTEYHILDLGTFTMTAAQGKNAIEIINEGRASASYALDIKADATNPGGITAGSTVVKTTGKSGVKDRPIIRFYNGIFNASNIISHSGSNGTNSPQFVFYNGVYNGNISTNRAICIFEGGTFNGKFYMSVDSSSYARIGGGKFKYMDNLYMSSLNEQKFTIGSAKGVFDRGVYVDDEGYIVVGGSVITDFGDKFKAKAKNVSKAGTYLPYSSAAEHGLYYTNAEAAIKKHGEANVDVKQ